MSNNASGFVHKYVQPTVDDDRIRSITLLLLHGTGGNENDLIPLGRALLPGVGLLSPRGKVLENGMPRFFRRLAEGIFDQEDLAKRTDELAEFITAAAKEYDFNTSQLIAVGFSNGANIAGSLLLRHPGVLRGAVLLSPMVPFEPDVSPDLKGTYVFIGAGRNDPIVSISQVERLAQILQMGGADVVTHWDPGGHQITKPEVDAAQRWIMEMIKQ